VVSAIRLLRVLAQAGRNIAAWIVQKGFLSSALQFIAIAEASPLAIPVAIEALQLWRVCAVYGYATEMFLEMWEATLRSVVMKSVSLIVSGVSRDAAEVQQTFIYSMWVINVAEVIVHAIGHKSHESQRVTEISHLAAVVQTVLEVLGAIERVPMQASQADSLLVGVCLQFIASYLPYNAQYTQSPVDNLMDVKRLFELVLLPIVRVDTVLSSFNDLKAVVTESPIQIDYTVFDNLATVARSTDTNAHVVRQFVLHGLVRAFLETVKVHRGLNAEMNKAVGPLLWSALELLSVTTEV